LLSVVRSLGLWSANWGVELFDKQEPSLVLLSGLKGRLKGMSWGKSWVQMIWLAQHPIGVVLLHSPHRHHHLQKALFF
jgi:hypothetical protein